ncbi:MAG: hypothetical protein ACC652_14735 [Acidimicrobiales bacterium]
MSKYWLMDQHGADGPTALVETDGSMHIIDVLRFGPGVTEVDDQQTVWDHVIGRFAPSMKPFVDAKSLDEEGVEPQAKLLRGGAGSRAGGHPDPTGRGLSAGRGGGSATFKGRRGDR